jgi:pyruvate dehydrogenase E2 component (dihydrolipoamide acetyltransferase)
VKKGEPLFEVQTEKITNTVESPAAGILFQILISPGVTVPVGTVIGVITQEGETAERLETAEAGSEDVTVKSPAKRAPSDGDGEKKFIPATPAARRLAKDLKIDLSLVPGSGPSGRVTESDVEKHHEAQPPTPAITPLALEMIKQEGLDISTVTGSGEGGKIVKADVERLLKPQLPDPDMEIETQHSRSIPYKDMRKAIGDNLHSSLQNTAQLTAFVEADITGMVKFRDLVRLEYGKNRNIRISYNDIIILATSRALKRFPIMNSTFSHDEILLHEQVNMGVAVALPEGLIVPVIKDADRKGLLQIAREARELADKARSGALDVEEVTGGTFTISNTSMFDVDGFTPILKPPETGILGVGRARQKPAVHQGEITIRWMMWLSLTYDHRVVDGAPAHEFLGALVQYLENPSLMLA